MKLSDVVGMLEDSGTEYDAWLIRSYCEVGGEDIFFNDATQEIGGTCLVVPSKSGESYVEWIFDLDGYIIQFAVWDEKSVLEIL